MNKSILLIDENLRFAQNLQQYFQAQDALTNVDVVTGAAGCQAMSKQQLANYKMVLTTPENYAVLKEQLAAHVVVLLYAGVIPAEYQDFYKVSKLVALDEIYHEVISLYAKTQNLISVSRDQKKTKVVSFFSPTGGSGKTSIALLTANILAEMGKRVLFIPLEDFNDRRLLYGAAEATGSLEQLFTGADMTAAIRYELNQLTAKNPQTNLHYLIGLESPEDKAAVETEDWQKFLELLQKETDYEYLVLDLSITEVFFRRHWIEQSDYVFCIGAKGYVEGLMFEKGMKYFCRRYPEQFELYGVVNSAKHSASQSGIDPSSVKAFCELGYDPQLKAVAGEEVVFPMDSGIAGRMRNFIYSVMER